MTPMEQKVTEAEVAAALGVWMRWACGETLHDRMRASLEAALSSRAPQAAGEGELGYATRLATSIWEKHYRKDSPDWRPLPDLYGVLTQLDNMTAGLSRAPQAGGDLPSVEQLARILSREMEGNCSHWRQHLMHATNLRRSIANEMYGPLDEPTPADAPKGSVDIERHINDASESVAAWPEWKRKSSTLEQGLSDAPKGDRALRSALYLANRDKESILRRLDTDIAGVEARPKSGEINETLRDGALGALRAFRAAIVEYEWTAPREHLTATQKLENIEDAIVDSILAEPTGAEGEALRRALEQIRDGYLGDQTAEAQFRWAQGVAREALSRSPYQGDPEALQDAIKLERRGKSE